MIEINEQTKRKMDKYFKTEKLDNFIKELEKEDRIRNSQLERLYNSGKFLELLKSAKLKYSRDRYKERWYKRGIEPPQELFWFLFDYAKKYGRRCTEKEWEIYSNTFITEMYFLSDYYFMRMDGQGSLIKIIKAEKPTYGIRINFDTKNGYTFNFYECKHRKYKTLIKRTKENKSDLLKDICRLSECFNIDIENEIRTILEKY